MTVPRDPKGKLPASRGLARSWQSIGVVGHTPGYEEPQSLCPAIFSPWQQPKAGPQTWSWRDSPNELNPTPAFWELPRPCSLIGQLSEAHHRQGLMTHEGDPKESEA